MHGIEVNEKISALVESPIQFVVMEGISHRGCFDEAFNQNFHVCTEEEFAFDRCDELFP